MKHEKIFKRADGSRVKLIVRFRTKDYKQGCEYSINAHTCKPKKRTWESVADSDCYAYRGAEDRREYVFLKCREVLTDLEIVEATYELWNKMKPDLGTITGAHIL